MGFLSVARRRIAACKSMNEGISKDPHLFGLLCNGFDQIGIGFGLHNGSPTFQPIRKRAGNGWKGWCAIVGGPTD